MRGYRGHAEETAQSLRGGWLYTGDIGELDRDGYLYIRGRKKELIIVSGYNVFPREVEEVLHGNPAISEASVVGRTDDYRGELPVAFVVARDGVAITAADLQAYCESRLAKYKIPVQFNIVPRLPKTTVGKIDKLALAEMAREGEM